MTELQFGTLTRCFPDKNFFFIRDDSTGKDVFTHVSGFAGKVGLPKGTRVRFHLVANNRRGGEFMAVDVEPIPAPIVPGVRQ
jgi:cold shock CspA family protein